MRSVESQTGDVSEERASANQKYYQIEKPQQPPNDILYFSVRGLEDTNEFQVYVYNKTLNFSVNVKSSSVLIAITLILNYFMFCF